jgi:hypothetical protein
MVRVVRPSSEAAPGYPTAPNHIHKLIIHGLAGSLCIAPGFLDTRAA